MEGAPYVENNLFQDQEIGLTLLADSPHTRVFRHNVFVRCSTAAIQLDGGKMPMPTASIRNSIFFDCATTILGEEALQAGLSHCIVNDCGALPTDHAARMIDAEPLSVTIGGDGKVDVGARDRVDGKGIRRGAEESATTADIGLTDGLRRVGVHPRPEVQPPPVRFANEPYVANATSEEYLVLRMNGMQLKSQSLQQRDGRPLDVMSIVDRDGASGELDFDISRFFGDSAYLKP